ncbi:MAG: hypothetical protein ABIK15_02215 [Pseudomonadota bacterium]
MNKKMKRCVQWVLIALIISVSSVWAGNRAMVEQRTKELDETNKQVVGQLPDLPKNGTVNIKAKASYKEGSIQFDVYDKKISDSEGKELRLDSDRNLDTGSVKEGTIYINHTKDIENGEKQENDPENN